VPDSATGDELIITRRFAAPRELVWRAWTEPERLECWWGPKGSTIAVMRFELRPGGIVLYRLRQPDGGELWGKFVYREIAPPERLSFVSAFADPEGNTVRAPFSATWPLEILNTLTLQERDGATTLTLRGEPLNANADERRTFREWRESVQQGFAGTFDQLAHYLAAA
jgi:uncharacterized protein YndB with AHSA1/START domain